MIATASATTIHFQHLAIQTPARHNKIRLPHIRENMRGEVGTVLGVIGDVSACAGSAHRYPRRKIMIVKRGPLRGICRHYPGQHDGNECQCASHSFTPFVFGASTQVAPTNAPLAVNRNCTLSAGTFVVGSGGGGSGGIGLSAYVRS
jgi:hypothetical protein